MFYGDEPRVSFVSLGPLTLWRQGVAHGLVQSLRFVAMTLAGFALAASTPPERLFAGLRALRVPFGLAFLVVTALRFVPDVAGEWAAVRSARDRRGRPAWRRAPWAWVAVEAGSLAPVLARALRRARALAESLDARGFDPVAPRAVRRPLRLGLADRGIGAAALVLATCVLICRLLFVLYTSDTWYHPALLPLYATVRAW
jgi:energy-coupling factor transport system permease protein